MQNQGEEKAGDQGGQEQVQTKAGVAQRVAQAFCQHAGERQGGSAARVGTQLGEQSGCDGVNVHFKGHIHGEGGHQDAGGNVTGTDGGDKSGQEKHQNRD